MFNYKVCPRMQTTTETHLEETLPKGSSVWPEGIYTTFFSIGYSFQKEMFCEVQPTTDNTDPKPVIQIDLKHFNIKGSLILKFYR